MRRLLLALCLAATVQASEWPKGYVVAEGSTSLDGHYGIVVGALVEDQVPDPAVNYFADLETRRIVGVIEEADYLQHENHRALEVEWSADSTICVADYEARFGFDRIVVLQPKGSTFQQTEIGAFVQARLDKVIRKQAADKETTCCATAYSHILANGKILFRTVGTTNPKGLDDQATYSAYFQGTYDTASHAWAATESRTLTPELYLTLSDALAFDAETNSTTYNNPADEAQAADQNLNEAYQAARFILPKERFAQIRTAQLAWLKKRDAITDPAEQTAFVKVRTRELAAALW